MGSTRLSPSLEQHTRGWDLLEELRAQRGLPPSKRALSRQFTLVIDPTLEQSLIENIRNALILNFPHGKDLSLVFRFSLWLSDAFRFHFFIDRFIQATPEPKISVPNADPMEQAISELTQKVDFMVRSLLNVPIIGI